MFRSKWTMLLAATVVSGSVLVWADDATTQPSEGHHHKGKLTKPWNELTDLTADQKAHIIAIHTKALKETKAIEAKEHEDILALLNDDQKKEVTALEEKSPEKHKAKDKAEAGTPDTQPAK